MGNVRNGHEKPPAFGRAAGVHGVVEVAGVLAVDGDQHFSAQIDEPVRVVGRGGGRRFRFGNDVVGKFRGNAVVQLGEPFLHGGVVFQTERGDGPPGPQMAFSMFFQLVFHGDAQKFSFFGGLFQRGNVGQHVEGEPGVRRTAEHGVFFAAGAQHAHHDVRLTAAHHGDDPSFLLLECTALSGQQHDVHKIAVPGVAHIFGRDVDVLSGSCRSILRGDEGRTGALRGENAAALLQGVGHDPASARDPDDFPVAGKIVQRFKNVPLELAGKGSDAENVVETQRASGFFENVEQKLLVEIFLFFHDISRGISDAVMMIDIA